MPTYDFRCEDCDIQQEMFMTLKEHEETLPICPECSTKMEQFFSKAPGVDLFPPFSTNNLKNLEGGPVEINSLSQIRALEKKYADRELAWEPGSYDTKYGEE